MMVKHGDSLSLCLYCNVLCVCLCLFSSFLLNVCDYEAAWHCWVFLSSLSQMSFCLCLCQQFELMIWDAYRSSCLSAAQKSLHKPPTPASRVSSDILLLILASALHLAASCCVWISAWVTSRIFTSTQAEERWLQPGERGHLTGSLAPSTEEKKKKKSDLHVLSCEWTGQAPAVSWFWAPDVRDVVGQQMTPVSLLFLCSVDNLELLEHGFWSCDNKETYSRLCSGIISEQKRSSGVTWESSLPDHDCEIWSFYHRRPRTFNHKSITRSQQVLYLQILCVFSSSWVKEEEEEGTWTHILMCQQNERGRIKQKYTAAHKQSELLQSAFKCHHTHTVAESSLEPDGLYAAWYFYLTKSPLPPDQWIQLQPLFLFLPPQTGPPSHTSRACAQAHPGRLAWTCFWLCTQRTNTCW